MVAKKPYRIDRVFADMTLGDLLTGWRLVASLPAIILVGATRGVTAVISVALLAVPGCPPFSGTTSLYRFFGYFGLFCSSVLVLRVLVAILHDGVN
jgi:hypothetical protein